MSNDFPNIEIKQLISGAHCSFDVPALPAVPEPIQSIDDTPLRLRAIDAWESAWALREIWALWARFLWCGSFGTMPDSATQSGIAERFPNLAAMGPVLEVLAQSKPLRGERKRQRELADDRVGITRGRTTRMVRGERRHYQGRGIQELHTAFQRDVRVHIRSLCLLGVSLPDFQRNVDCILFDALAPMAIRLDCTGDGPPVNFPKESERLLNEGFRQMQSAVRVLLEMLERKPRVVLKSQNLELQSCQSSSDQQPDSKYKDDEQSEDIENRANDSGPDNSSYLGIHLDDTSNAMSRDGVAARCYLSRTHMNLTKLLVDAEGAVVKFDNLRSAWPHEGSGVTNPNIHSVLSKLNSEIGKLELRAKNIRGDGYRLIDAGKTG